MNHFKGILLDSIIEVIESDISSEKEVSNIKYFLSFY